MRIGQGFDAHPLAAGRMLVLGGVIIGHDRGLAGHSDGDVLVHAFMDALLGAAALGDKGQHFPSRDPQYKDISSLLLLKRVGELLKQAQWRVANLDATIVAERPVLAPHIAAMRANVANALAVDVACVSIKATTSDRMGFTGRGEGIAALAVALVEPSE